MAKPGAKPKLTPSAIKTAIRLRREGVPQSTIATRLGVDVSQISRCLKKAEEQGEVLPVSTVGRPRKNGSARDVVVKQRGFNIGVGPFPQTPNETLAELSARLPELAQARRDALADEEYKLFLELSKIEIDLAARIHAATPPDPPDPEEDPANVAARDSVRAELQRLAERFERDNDGT